MRIRTKTRDSFGYGAILFGYTMERFLGSQANSFEMKMNRVLSGYPSNHNYKIRNRKIFPSFQLYERLRVITFAYPDKLGRFLDIGCCRGYFVLNAAYRPDCDISVGIDVHEPFVSISDKVRKYLNVERAGFHHIGLEAVASDPGAFGGPFDTVLLVGTYHYLFWGSGLDATSYGSHDEILSMLSAICSGNLVVSARFEVDMLPHDIRRRAESRQGGEEYSTTAFLEAAEKYFCVCHKGYLSKYPVFVLTRKPSPTSV